MTYKDYKIARDRAWEVLTECKITSVPINLADIINYYNIKIIKFSDSSENLTGDGFSLSSNKNIIIYYNNIDSCIQRQRFTIAHELGHCLLGHLKNKGKTFYRNVETDVSDPMEQQANVFARDILMPAVVLHYTNCIKYTDIMRLCDVSETSAQIREQRMKVLEERNKFCTSPLEKQVYDNFSNFIKAYKK